MVRGQPVPAAKPVLATRTAATQVHMCGGNTWNASTQRVRQVDQVKDHSGLVATSRLKIKPIKQ